jgi:hypothetical protein
MIKYFKSKKCLIEDHGKKESEIIESQRKKWFENKLKIISEYENKVISESQRAADDREKEMLKIVESKDMRIRELELEILDLKSSYRDFKSEVQDYEVLAQKLNVDVQAAMTITNQLAAKFEGIKYEMGRVNQRIEKKDKKLIEGGKS